MRHVHFEGKFFEIVPSCENLAYWRQNGNDDTVFENGTYNHTNRHDEYGRAVEKTVATSEMVIHPTMTPPLFVIEAIQQI